MSTNPPPPSSIPSGAPASSSQPQGPTYTQPNAGPPYPAPPYPAQPYPPLAPRSGSFYWWLLAVAYIPIPMVSTLAAVIAQVIARGKAKRSGLEIVEANSRNALNWSLTWLTSVVVLYVTAIVLVNATGNPPPPWVNTVIFSLIGLYLVGGVVTLIWMIIGGTQGKERVVRCPLAIPFVRAPR